MTMSETPEDKSEKNEKVKKDITDSNEFKKVFNFEGILIGFIIGSAVTSTVGSFTNDLLNPFIGLIIDDKNLLLENYSVTIHGSEFLYGSFLLQFAHLMILLGIVYWIYRFFMKRKSNRQVI